MIQWVFEQAQKAKFLSRIIIATEDDRIVQASRAFGAEALLTSPKHNSGTDRAAEIAEKMDFSIIVNIQGDEPLVRGEMIDALLSELQDGSIHMATLARKNKDLSLIRDENVVKVVMDARGFALYFSRSPIPFKPKDFFWEHIGIYGFQRESLLEFCRIPQSTLEKTERLEQLRALENGFRIKVIENSLPTLSVDTPLDIISVEKKLKKRR